MLLLIIHRNKTSDVGKNISLKNNRKELIYNFGQMLDVLKYEQDIIKMYW